MDQFLTFLISPLLTEPSQLAISTSSAVITLHVNPADMGRVIGKHGIVISALRQLLRVYCLTHNHPPVTLTLAESQP